MFSPGGVDATSLMSSIAGFADLGSRQVDHDRLLAAEGAGHIVHDLPLRTDGRMVGLESRPWRLDPVPLVIDGDDVQAQPSLWDALGLRGNQSGPIQVEDVEVPADQILGPVGDRAVSPSAG